MAGRQTITVRDSSLLEAVIVALESGEYRQIVGSVTDGADGRCAIGVIHAVLERAGLPQQAIGQFRDIDYAAGARLGYACVADANDDGVSLERIGAAMRAEWELGVTLNEYHYGAHHYTEQ